MEQNTLFCLLPAHLADMAIFAVNTGCRDAEICNLLWGWEVAVRELQTSIFIISVKNGEERLVALNRVAKSVIEARRGIHPEYVFTYKGRPIRYMLNPGWRTARASAGMPHVRVHDLKHTFGRRLRGAGVSFEDRQDLLGHRSARITTHYSAAELSRLLEAANSVCEQNGTRPELLVLRGALEGDSHKTPAKVTLRTTRSSAKWLRSLAGMPGFEPGNGGIKIRCLTTWLHPNPPGKTGSSSDGGAAQ